MGYDNSLNLLILITRLGPKQNRCPLWVPDFSYAFRPRTAMSGNFNATSNSVSSFEFMLTVRIFHSDLRRSGRRDYRMILLHTMGNNHAEKVADGLFVHFYREH